MKSKSSRGKEIIKIQVEIIKIENLKAIEKIKETKLALCRDKLIVFLDGQWRISEFRYVF